MLGDDPKHRTPKLDKADLRRIGVFRHLRSIPENACRKARVEFSVHTPCNSGSVNNPRRQRCGNKATCQRSALLDNAL
jgi:hypothetical protein